MKSERAQFLARYLSYIKVGEVITTATTQEANTGDYAGRGMLVDGSIYSSVILRNMVG